ncbi:hypothetical protein JCM5353_007356 [Sporobolomyces roseus]
MSNSPRPNSVYEESPDTTFENAGASAMEANNSERKARSRDGSQEMELDYGESDEENDVGKEKAELFENSMGSDDDRGKYKGGTQPKSSDSPQARQRLSPSSYIASPWQRRRSLSPPRPRSPSPISARRYEPSVSPPPHSAFPSPNISRAIPPPHPTTISTSLPELIRLHLCLPCDLPSRTFTNYLNSLSPAFQVYEQKLYTAQRAAMGFIVVEKQLWESGEIERRIRRRGEMEFGLRGDRRWGIKLSIARDQNFSSISGVWQSDRSGSPRLRQSSFSPLVNRRRSLSPRRHHSNHSPLISNHHQPSLSQSTSSAENSHFLPPSRTLNPSSSPPELIKLYLILPTHLPDSALLNYFSSLSPPITIHSHSLHTHRSPAVGFILVSRSLWETGEIDRRIEKRGGIWLERSREEWGIKLSVARDQVQGTRPADQMRDFQVWHPKYHPTEWRSKGREEIVGLILDGFGRSTRLSEVEGMLRGTLRFWESLRLEASVGERVWARLEVRGEKAAMIVERDFDGFVLGGQRIRVGRVYRDEDRYGEREKGRRGEGEMRSREIGAKEVERDETRWKSRDKGRSRSPSRDRHRSSRSKRSRKEEDETEQVARIEKKKRRKSEYESTRDPSPQRRSRNHSSSHRHSRHSERSPSPVYRSRQRSKFRSISPASNQRQSRSRPAPALSSSPKSPRYSRSAYHHHQLSKTRQKNPSPESLPPRQGSSPDLSHSNPRHWREDTPILRSSPSSSRVPLPRPPTPLEPSTSSNSQTHTSSNRPQLFRPVAVRPWQSPPPSSQYPRGGGEDRWARNGWNQVGREQIARETREREESWNRRD